MKISNFPDLKQSYEYDCGAVALQSVFLHYGIETTLPMIEEVKTKETGTTIENIEKTITKYGLKFDSRSMTIEDLKKYLDRAIPVIVLFQAWPVEKEIDWKNDWEDGHYAVAIGYDENKIYLEDPYIKGRAEIIFDEFIDRWHDIIGNQKYFNHGIAVYRKEH